VGRGRSFGGTAGFTLVEVVVSLSILAMVAGGLSVAFRMTAQSMERGADAVHASVRQRARFGVLERAFRGANPAPVPTDNGDASWFLGERDRVSFLSVSPHASGYGSAFRLLSFHEGRLPTGENGLLLSERAPFGTGDPDGGKPGDGSRVVYPGASGVTFFYVSGFTPGGTMETENSWDARKWNRLPLAVGIEFTSEGESAKRRIVIPLPVGLNQEPDKRPPLDAGPIARIRHPLPAATAGRGISAAFRPAGLLG
jgi:prepilin-type N-terminal cleavage/methylation domain-containing protein